MRHKGGLCTYQYTVLYALVLCSVHVLSVTCGAEHTIAMCQEGVRRLYPYLCHSTYLSTSTVLGFIHVFFATACVYVCMCTFWVGGVVSLGILCALPEYILP